MQRFLNDRSDKSHAFINGSNSTKQGRGVRPSAHRDLFHRVITLGLGRRVDDLRIFHIRPTNPPILSLKAGRISYEKWPGTSTGSDCSHDHQPASTPSSEASDAPATASLASDTASSRSSIAMTASGALVQHAVESSFSKKDHTINANHPGPDDSLDSIPSPPHWHSGDRQCAYKYDEATFDDCVEHTIKTHLRQTELQQVACPFCPTILIHDSPSNHNDSTLKEVLQHLREHSPWIAGQCEWPLLHPKTFHRSDIPQPQSQIIGGSAEVSQPTDDSVLSPWGGGQPDEAVPKHRADKHRRGVLREIIKVLRRTLSLRPLIAAHSRGGTSRTGSTPSGSQGPNNTAPLSGAGVNGKKHPPHGQRDDQGGADGEQSEGADQGGNGKRRKTIEEQDLERQKMLACVFYKQNPGKHPSCLHSHFSKYSTMRCVSFLS